VQGRLQPYTFLLAGVVLNAFSGALIMFVNAVADFFQAHGILFWLMGNLSSQSYGLALGSAAYLLVGVAWLMRHTREFNALTLGEESAAQLGVDVVRTRRVAFVVSSLLVGAAVSVSGMIGFVGLIVPHVTRLLLGADYRLLLPASVLIGAMFLVLADTIARSAFGASEIPVGVVTALFGGPFFIYLLRREGGRSFE
jgi:iron complex transport system permease protein